MKTQKIIIFIILGLASLLIGTGVGYMIMQSDSSLYSFYYIQTGSDDARTFIAENSPTGYGDEDGAWALLQLSPSYSFGLRFNNVTIPHNAKIQEAYVRLFSVGTPRSSSPNCMIYGDRTNNS